MPQQPPARPGDSLEDVDTPALLIELDAFERNLRRMADAASAAGVALRPHAKMHKSPAIALRQIELGAVGVCCQKVSEAEVMVEGGIGDVLVSNEVVGRRKLERLAALSHRARISVAVDHADSVAALSDVVAAPGSRIGVLIEIDVGAARCGVEPGDEAVRLAALVARSPGLELIGLQAYHGRAQHMRSSEERRAAIAGAVEHARCTRDLMLKAGLPCDIVTGAGTGTFELEAGSGVYTELQAGSYCFMDADYARNRKADGSAFDTFEHALFVNATVMSTPVPQRAVVDAGLKALAFDSGPPLVPDHVGAIYERPSDEHGSLNLAACNARPRLGDKVMLVPGHCDPTVNLHDWYVGIRGMRSANPSVECVWPVAARGALF